MRCEVPLFERFCFCFPLRFGLILWACIKLLLACVLLAEVTISGVLISIYGKESFEEKGPTLLMFLIVFSLSGIDIILDMKFIQACCQKNGDLMKKFYYFNIFLLVLSIIFVISVFYLLPILPIVPIDTEGSDVLNVLIVAIQIYVLLIVRSEIVKLTIGGEFNQDDCKDEDVESSNGVKNTEMNNRN